jgi:hypothetical protein
MKWILSFFIITMNSACSQAQKNMNQFIVNGDSVPASTISTLEKTYGVKFTPGDYWYDRMTGAYGVKGGPCTGVGVAGLSIGGQLKADASGGSTGVFINGRELHPLDVAGLQTFMLVMQGRYWTDAYGNFGYENNPAPLGNIYLLYQAKFKSSGTSSSYKNNVWSGEKRSFGGDGSFMYYSSKKTDGTTYDY